MNAIPSTVAAARQASRSSALLASDAATRSATAARSTRSADLERSAAASRSSDMCCSICRKWYASLSGLAGIGAGDGAWLFGEGEPIITGAPIGWYGIGCRIGCRIAGHDCWCTWCWFRSCAYCSPLPPTFLVRPPKRRLLRRRWRLHLGPWNRLLRVFGRPLSAQLSDRRQCLRWRRVNGRRRSWFRCWFLSWSRRGGWVARRGRAQVSLCFGQHLCHCFHQVVWHVVAVIPH